MDHRQLFQEIRSLVREAGQLIINADPFEEVHAKQGTANYVTRYDSMVQKFLVERLSALLPSAAFVGEEDGYSAHRIQNGYTFIIDPIDGTTNFICDFLCSGICVGLSLNNEMLMGFVYNPFRDELFSALRGHGAYLNDKKLTAPDRALKDGVVCVDIAPYNPELREKAFANAKAISYHCMDIRNIGSAALSICYVAAGRSVAYLSPKLCVWDYAAASLIAEEAGALVTLADGSTPAFSTGVPIIAGVPKAHQEVCSLLQS